MIIDFSKDGEKLSSTECDFALVIAFTETPKEGGVSVGVDTEIRGEASDIGLVSLLNTVLVETPNHVLGLISNEKFDEEPIHEEYIKALEELPHEDIIKAIVKLHREKKVGEK